MRPRIVDALAEVLGRRAADYLVPTGTTMLALAIALVWLVMVNRGRKAGLSVRYMTVAGVVGVLAGLAGSRLFHLMQHLTYSLDHPRLFLRPGGGTASWGGYLAGTAAFLGVLVARRQPVRKHLDLLASALGLGPAVARWGCFLNGCCFGVPSTLPWAVRYPDSSFAYAAHRHAGLIAGDAALSAPVHPVQAYASIFAFALFGATSFFWHRFRSRPGTTFCFYWMVYGIVRFPVEFLRGDVPRYGSLHLTLSQYMCVVFTVGGAWGLWWIRSAGRRRKGIPVPGV